MSAVTPRPVSSLADVRVDAAGRLDGSVAESHEHRDCRLRGDESTEAAWQTHIALSYTSQLLQYILYYTVVCSQLLFLPLFLCFTSA